MMTIFDRAGGSYSWGRVPLRRQTLYGKSTIYQESTPKVCETVIPSDWKVDQGSDRDWWSDHNWLRTANVKINDSTMWQSYWDYECQKPTSFRLRTMSGKYQKYKWPTNRSLEKSWIKWYLETRFLKDLNRIDGEPMELEWKIFPGFTTLGILQEFQQLTELQGKLEQFKGRIILMSMYDDIVWRERGNTEKMPYEFCYSCEWCSQILAGTLVILGTWIREEMVRNSFWLTRWIMGSNGRRNDAQLCRKRSPDISCHWRQGKVKN